jgi:hypothetical protein
VPEDQRPGRPAVPWTCALAAPWGVSI